MSTEPQNKLFQTNDYSIISKYSCVKGGYQHDAVLETFIENWLKVKSWKRTSLINRGYAARMMSIDWIISRSIKFEGVDCVIILGAGFDFLPFRLNSSHCYWIELDLPEIVSTKSQFIQSERILGDGEDLVQIRQGQFRSTSSRYHLVECDLRNSEMLSSCLKGLFSSVKANNVAILNEVCLCYIDIDENRRILSNVIDAVRDCAMRVHYIGYEQYRPSEKSPFNSVMSEHFAAMSYPLKHFPSPNQLRRLFIHDLNFDHLTITPVFQIYQTALEEERETFKTAYEDQPFDEYEELSLYLSHYALVTGVLILKDPFIDPRNHPRSDYKKDLVDALAEMKLGAVGGSINFVPSQLERYAHSSCTVDNGDGTYKIFISGGFGTNLGRPNIPHRRLGDCVVIRADSDHRDDNFSMKHIGTENIDPNSVKLDRMHGQIVSLGTEKLFFNGGRHNPQKQGTPPVAFTARLIEDNELEVLHILEDSAPFACWRHKVCAYKNSYEFIQVGGLNASNREPHPLVLWNLSADKLGAHLVTNTDIDLFRRHSFAMDARNSGTIFLVGGLQTRRKDSPVKKDRNTILWDTRKSGAEAMSFGCANSYGSSVNFINDEQLIKIGGVSTETGLAETTVQLLDLRNKKHLMVAEDLLPLAEQRMILSGTAVCHSREAREIITTGGGGNYFTFGTRFNKSHLLYKYT